jgi:Holliday junction resolvase RusA-like endonuclease
MHAITVSTIPSVNHYVKHTKRGGHYKDPKVSKFIDEVNMQLWKADIIPSWVHIDIVKKKPLRLALEFYLNENMFKRDLDNMPKVFIDCLANRFKFNDSRIVFLRLEKFLIRKEEREMIGFEFLTTEARNERD